MEDFEEFSLEVEHTEFLHIKYGLVDQNISLRNILRADL